MTAWWTAHAAPRSSMMSWTLSSDPTGGSGRSGWSGGSWWVRAKSPEPYCKAVSASGQVSRREDFRRGCSIAGATDSAWSVDELQAEVQRAIQVQDPRCGLVREDHRPAMDQIGRAHV